MAFEEGFGGQGRVRLWRILRACLLRSGIEGEIFGVGLLLVDFIAVFFELVDGGSPLPD